MNDLDYYPNFMLEFPMEWKNQVLTALAKRINDTSGQTIAEAAIEMKRAKNFARFLNDTLSVMGVSPEQFAEHSGIPLELIEALNEGILPASEIGDQLLIDISRAIHRDVKVFQAILGRTSAADFSGTSDDDVQWALAYRYHIIAPDLKRSIARHFVEHHLGNILSSSIRSVFFESGSAVAFLVEELIDALERHEDWAQCWNIGIETNNYLVTDRLKEFTYLPFVQYPVGQVKRPFGATFGKNLLELSVEPPPSILRSLSEGAKRAVAHIRQHFIEHYRENGLIFMAASGLEASLNSPFPGPHVGDYYNQLFKRAILESRCPTIIFLHDDKFTDGFKVGHCYSVCNQDFTWSNVVRKQPIALAVGCSNEHRANELRKQLMVGGFTHVNLEKTADGHWALMAMSEHFHRFWKSAITLEGEMSILK